MFEYFLLQPEPTFFLDNLKECTPKNITLHTRWSKLVIALRNANNVLANWKAVFDLCFRRKFQPLDYPPNAGYCNKSLLPCRYSATENDNLVFDPSSCWTYAKHGFEVLNSLETAFVEEIREFESCASPFVGYTEGYNRKLFKSLKTETTLIKFYFDK